MENNSITKYSPPRQNIALSTARQTAIQNWRERPTQYYSMLPVSTPRKMIEADTPTLWEIQSQLGKMPTLAILVKVFLRTVKLVNLEKNLTDEQMGEAATDILNDYGYLKVEEIKYLLKRALRSQNVYGRLDYNVIMNWVEQYDAERTEEAINISEQEDMQRQNEPADDTDAISFEEYIAGLEQRAGADAEAAELLAKAKEFKERRSKYLTKEERTQKDRDFKEWFTFSYLLGKKD